MWRRKATGDKRQATAGAAPIVPVGSPAAPDQIVRRLHWTVQEAIATYLGGDARSQMRSPGFELAELRPYQPGDDIRHIDWNITARADEPFVRESHAERALDVWLVLDLSASVDWGTAECVKRERALEFAEIAGHVLGRHGHRVGALAFAHRPLLLMPPASGRTHLLRTLAHLRHEPLQAQRGATDLAAALHRANVTFRRRSLVIVASDFLVADGWQAPLRTLAQRHDVVAAQLHDPREAALPDVGLITLEDPETGQQLTVNTSDRALRERYHAAAQQQADRIHSDLIGCGADHVIMRTDAAVLPTLVKFLNARKLRRGKRSIKG